MIIWLLHLLLVSSASAQEPVWQRVTRADGLDTNWVRDLYQGPDHRIVMGTSVGVFAWDGDRARRIDGGRIRTEIQRLERFGDGLVARDKRGRLWSIDGDRTRQVQANGVDLTARDMAWTDEGLVYVANDRSIWVLKPDESARQLLPSVHDARRVWRAPGGWIFATSEGWFRTQDGQTTSLKHRVFGSEDALVSSDGTVWLADGRGVWTLSGPGPPVLRLAMDRTRVALAERNQSVWAAGEVLARFSGTEVEQSWTAKDGYRGRGEALMVDHEGGLWAGSGQGAAYVAEPSLVRWAPKHGLADRAPRRMAWHQDALWVSHWNGFSAIRDGEVAVDEQVFSPSEPCADMQGSVWFIDTPTAQGGAPVLRSVANDDRRSWPVSSGRHFFEACHADENQEVWLTAGDRLLRAGAGQWTDAGPLPKPKARGTLRALHVHDGVASYSVDTAFCQMRVEELETAADWRCVDVGGDQHIMSIARDEHGQFWVVGTDDTVLVGGLDGWRSPVSASSLPGTYVVFVEPSPRGGLWIGGEGPLMRVEMAPSQDDWQVLETIDGLVADTLSMPVDLIETRSGTVYLTVRIGVIELAAQARSRSLPPPKVTLVEAMADGEVQALDGEATVRLAEPNSRLQLRVAMHSYRSRRDLVVRTRLDGGAWSPPTDARTLRWEELESGVRTLAVQASRGGQEWGPATTLSVHVPLPWFGRWQVWALTLVALVLVFFLIWRARTQAALREERMRSRVAMDLHDEVGGELGALRLLMGLLGRDLPADQREQVSTRAGRSLASMTASVRGIVWSLQPSRRDLQGLADHLSERARTALPHLGDALHIHVDLPNDPVLLTLEAVRGVRLLVREALHNIAKHSQARTVWLEVGAADRGRWRVQVRDDGVGFSIDERGRAGAGLTSMRARAAEIGAEIDVRSDSSGTVIELVIRGR